ncbi:hypothetical protein QAD02_007991 [Eretmocerus hayati]|uniref:Uncharacterized protein n=1 Tax=Eretmocerus hayati TaxID=131215 RepID=A0ACC2N5J7_9HYME|nr:hypothetical protein QAD02_007991 [Eretmocerus hayati]
MGFYQLSESQSINITLGSEIEAREGLYRSSNRNFPRKLADLLDLYNRGVIQIAKMHTQAKKTSADCCAAAITPEEMKSETRIAITKQNLVPEELIVIFPLLPNYSQL